MLTESMLGRRRRLHRPDGGRDGAGSRLVLRHGAERLAASTSRSIFSGPL